MEEFLNELPKLAKEKEAATNKYFQKLKKRTPKRLDVIMQDLHEEAFNHINCLDCANCCKTTSPLFTDVDIRRIAKHLKIKEHQFIAQYLRIDEERFYVLKETPCPFLDLNDNMCFIYDVRPKACKEYPHTNRRKFIQLTNLTLKNTEICPAVFNIVEELKKKLPL